MLSSHRQHTECTLQMPRPMVQVPKDLLLLQPWCPAINNTWNTQNRTFYEGFIPPYGRTTSMKAGSNNRLGSSARSEQGRSHTSWLLKRAAGRTKQDGTWDTSTAGCQHRHEHGEQILLISALIYSVLYLTRTTTLRKICVVPQAINSRNY
jgi:hypothetical protein